MINRYMTNCFDLAARQWQCLMMAGWHKFLFLILCLAILVSPPAALGNSDDGLDVDRTIEANYQIEIIGENGTRQTFSVARVADQAGHARGLMHVPHLAPDTGMLFVFDPPRKVGFWMRNTRIPLDMIFIGEDGRIANIVTRHDINSDRLTTSRKPVAAVLEIAAGRAAALGVVAGHIVRPLKGGV